MEMLQAGLVSDSGCLGSQRGMGILAARLREGIRRVMRVIKAVRGEGHLSYSNAMLVSIP